MDKPSSFIVKVQLSEFASDEVRKMLIYNEDHSVLLELDATPEMVAALNNEPKTFWLATLVMHTGLSTTNSWMVPRRYHFNWQQLTPLTLVTPATPLALATLDDKHQLFLLRAVPWQDW